MKFAALHRRRPTRRAVCFALALVLQPLCGFLTERIHQLHQIPFSLFFLSTVVIASLGGLGPSLLAVALAVLINSVRFAAGHAPWASLKDSPSRFAVLVAAAALISFISEGRRRSEEKLRIALGDLQDRSDDLVATLGSSKCACWTLDLEGGQSARWFSGSYQVFGRPFDEIEKMPSLISLLHEEDRPRLVQLAEEMRSTSGPIVFEYRAPWPNGEIHWLEMRGNRTAGAGCRWRGVTVDITERKLTEAALLHSEKLAAMGRLASTVAHEINNPLEAVTNLLYLARSCEGGEEEMQAYLATADRELARLSNITRLTLGFVRTSGLAADTDVAAVVDEVLSMFQHRLDSRNVQVEREYESEVSVRIAPHELRQIATNLVSNAADAVGVSEGRIAIRVLREEEDGVRRGVLLVEDNGSGIDEASLPHIFDPFFSTKDEIGTGIGLWVTKELVEKSGGRIQVASGRAGSGAAVEGKIAAAPRTQFRIELPLAS